MLSTDSFFSAQGLESTRFRDQEHPCFVWLLYGICTIDIRQRSVRIFLGYFSPPDFHADRRYCLATGCHKMPPFLPTVNYPPTSTAHQLWFNRRPSPAPARTAAVLNDTRQESAAAEVTRRTISLSSTRSGGTSQTSMWSCVPNVDSRSTSYPRKTAPNCRLRAPGRASRPPRKTRRAPRKTRRAMISTHTQ
jgi:hypothetical protein